MNLTFNFSLLLTAHIFIFFDNRKLSVFGTAQRDIITIKQRQNLKNVLPKLLKLSKCTFMLNDLSN